MKLESAQQLAELNYTKTHRIRRYLTVYRSTSVRTEYVAQADPMKHSVRLVPSWQQLFQHRSLGPCRLRGWKSSVCLRAVDAWWMRGGWCWDGTRATHRPQNAPLVRVLLLECESVHVSVCFVLRGPIRARPVSDRRPLCRPGTRPLLIDSASCICGPISICGCSLRAGTLPAPRLLHHGR